MRVLKLSTKPAPGAPMLPCDRLILHRGFGIQGDHNAGSGSPRQVLIVDLRSLNDFGLQPGDLHENILVDADVETVPSGHILQIGSALIRPTFHCEPCAKLERLRKGLAKQLIGQRGILGMVVRDGTVAIGDSVTATKHTLPALPDDAKGRFDEFVARIPAGSVVRTSDLLLAMGVAKAYYRAIPAFLKKAPPELPVHRVVAIDGRLFTRYLPKQAEALAAEGVVFTAGKVTNQFLWHASHFHELEAFGAKD